MHPLPSTVPLVSEEGDPEHPAVFKDFHIPLLRRHPPYLHRLLPLRHLGLRLSQGLGLLDHRLMGPRTKLLETDS